MPFVGTLSHPSIEALRAGSAAPLFFQLYVYGDRRWLEGVIDRVEQAGYSAICITVDVSTYGRRERDSHNRYLPRKSRERPHVGSGALVPAIVNRDGRAHVGGRGSGCAASRASPS